MSEDEFLEMQYEDRFPVNEDDSWDDFVDYGDESEDEDDDNPVDNPCIAVTENFFSV